MTARTWRVPVRINPHTGKTEHAFVWADSAEAARAQVEAIGEPQLALPWLDVDKPVTGTDLAPIEDGTRQADGTIGAKHPRTAEVMAWLREYEGRNDFVKDVRFKVENGRIATGRNAGQKKAYRLSHKQVEALAQVKDREAAWEKQRAERPKTGLNLWASLPYGTTYAAAENERGTLSFVKMDKVESGKWADWVFVKAVIGGNEDMRLGSQRPDSDDYSGQWTVVLANACADMVEAVKRYGLELGVCGVCNRQLTNDESRRLGIGPVCLGRLNAA